MKRILLFLSTTIITLILLVSFGNEWLMKHDRYGLLRPFVWLFNPPNGGVRPFVKERVRLSQNGSFESKFQYQNEYYGLYGILLEFKKAGDISYTNHNRLFFDFEVECTSLTNQKYHSNGSSATWGYFIGNYLVPEELPINETVECDVTLMNMPIEFLREYGPAYIKIIKLADI